MDVYQYNPNVYNPNTNYAAATEKAAGEADAARKNLENYSRNIQDYGKLYEQNLGQAEQRYGFNPADLQKAQRALAVTNTTIANLPEAIRQAGNYYGTTTGGFTNAYQQAAGRLQGLAAGQSNMVNSYQAAIAASQALANAQAGYTVMSEKQKQEALNQIADYALKSQGLSQELQIGAGGYQTGIAEAQSQRLQAQAIAAQAAAQAELARTQAEANRIQNEANKNALAQIGSLGKTFSSRGAFQDQAGNWVFPGGQKITSSGVLVTKDNQVLGNIFDYIMPKFAQYNTPMTAQNVGGRQIYTGTY